MKKLLMFSAAVVSTMMMGTAIAGMPQMPQRGAPGAALKAADANKDGTVSRAEMIASAEARFAKLDANKDGKVTPEERRNARAQAMTVDRATFVDRAGKMFDRLDADRNGSVSQAEAEAARGKMRERMGRRWGRGQGGPGMAGPGMMAERAMQRGARMFDRLDANSDGKVTRAEANAASAAQIDRRFARLDTNKDGAIDKAEAAAAQEQARGMMQRWRERRGGGMGGGMGGNWGGGMMPPPPPPPAGGDN